MQFCINKTDNRSIKITPSKILFDLNQQGDSNDYLRLILEVEENQEDENKNLRKIRNSGKKNIYDTQLKTKSYFDKSRKPLKNYSVGE